jgi:hypothetical protein
MVERRTIVIISLVLSFLSLIYIVLSYYGITRFISLHMYPTKDYVKNFKLLEKACPGRVVISLTSTPKKLLKITAVINSILDQTVKVDEIALNIPYKFHDTNQLYVIPKELEDIIHVYRCGVDYGPMTCLIPTLLREKEASTKIIYLDDDIIYGKDFIETLVDDSISKDGVGKAIFTNGWTTNQWKGDGHPNIICSKGGVLIQPEFLGSEVIENVNVNTNADIWVSGWLHKHKTPLRQVSYGDNMRDWGSRSKCRIPLSEAEKKKQIAFFTA